MPRWCEMDRPYKCSTCGKEKPRADLLAKRVAFTTIKPVRTIRSRVTGWVCSLCRAEDPDWNQPKYSGSPGAEQNITLHITQGSP